MQKEGGSGVKRPFAVIGFSYLSALVLAFTFAGRAALLLGLVCLIFGVLCLFFRANRGMAALTAGFLSAAVAFGGYWFFQTGQVEPVSALAGHTAHIQGEITRFSSDRTDGTRISEIHVTQCSFPDAPQDFVLKFYSTGSVDAELYDFVECDVEFEAIENTVTFDAVNYNRARNLFVAARQVSECTVSKPDHKGIRAFFASLQSSLSAAMSTGLSGENGALASAMLLGDRSMVSGEMDADFKASGVIHILSISGTHIMLMCAILYLLARKLPIGYTARNLFCVIGAPAYCLLVGCPFSAVRAAIMAVVCFGVRMFDKQADSINSLGLAVFLILFFSPGAAMDLSFQLSVAATFGILFYQLKCHKKVQEYLYAHGFSARLLIKVVDGILASILITFLTFPLIAMSYGRISLIAPLANLFLSPLVVVELAAGFAFCLFSLVPVLSFLVPMASFFLNLAGTCMGQVSHLLSEIPYVYPAADAQYLYFWYFGTLGLFAVAFFFRKKKRLYLHAGLLSVCVLCTGLLSYQFLMRDVVQVVALDSRNPSNLAVVQNGHAVIIGAGSGSYQASTTASYLKSMGIDTVDVLILPRDNSSAVRAANRLLDEMEASVVVGNEALYRERTAGEIYSFHTMNLSLWKDMQISVDAKEESSRIDVTIGGKKISIINGEASFSKEEHVDVIAFSQNAKVNALPGYDSRRILLGSGDKTYGDLLESGEEDLCGYESFPSTEGIVLSYKDGGEIKQRKERG